MAGSILRRRPSADQVVAWAVVAGTTLFVLRQLYPSLILRDTTPVEADLPAHLFIGRHLRYHLLPGWRLSGWSADWFTGFPMFHFYFPLAGLLVAFVDLLLPYSAALKLVAATGPLALPPCAYAFGRLSGCTRLTSACLGVSVLPLLLLPTLSHVGGSMAASVGGEYAYGLALGFGLVVLGLARRGLRTGRHRALTALLLAAATVLHLVVVVMAVVGIAVATALRPAWARVRWTAPVFAVAGLLTGVWAVPFLLRAGMTVGPSIPRYAPLSEWLFPPEMIPVFVLAFVAVVGRLVRDPENPDELTLFLLLMTAVFGVLFVVVPGGRVPNGRFLPIFFLWLCLLGGYGLSRLARAVDEVRRELARGHSLHSPSLARLAAPAVALVAFLPLYDTRDWRGVLTQTTRFEFLPEAAKRQFGGRESSFMRAESRDFVDTMQTVARRHGCGRVHTELAEGTWSDIAQPLHWLIPYWTDGCLTTTRGFFSEASATSPYVDLITSLVSSPSEDSGRPATLDLAAGVTGLRSLGVRYFVANHPKTVEAADATPDLRPVAETESYAGASYEQFGEAYWKVYELPAVAVVEPLRSVPVVVPGVARSVGSWETAIREWFEGGRAEGLTVAAAGPSGWPRHDRVSDGLPRRPVAAVAVSRVRVTHDRVSFEVSRTGVPVLVRVSYFPNWRASGAEGPWRVLPNQMVVVPTARTVTLRYGRTGVDHAGRLATLVGIGGLVVLARRGPVEMPVPAEASERPKPMPARAQSLPKRKKRRRR